MIDKMTLGPRSLYNTWKPVTLDEMKAFIGLIINMGIVQLQDIKDYWSHHETLDLHLFRNVMTRDRFSQIFNMLHVGDIDGSRKRHKIQPLLDKLLPNIQKLLIPQRHLSINEAMISFKGRVGFKQYIKDKPSPWGIKAYVLTESKTGYVCNIIVYYGKETLINTGTQNQTTRVVLTLIDPYKCKGYDLFTDRFYTSPELALYLAKCNTTITGTIQSNRRGLPEEIRRDSRKKTRGNIDAYRVGRIMAMEWTDKRRVLMLTTKPFSMQTETIPSRSVTCSKIHYYSYTYHNMLYVSLQIPKWCNEDEAKRSS